MEVAAVVQHVQPADNTPSSPTPPNPIAVPTKTNTAQLDNDPFSGTASHTVIGDELIVSGRVDVPKRNHIILAAPCNAVLMSLQTPQNNIETKITEGMFVKKGQLLGKFDDRTLQNQLQIDEGQLKVAIAAEEKLIEIKYAEQSVRVAATKLDILKKSNEQHANTISSMEILLAGQELLQAQANLELCQYTIQYERAEETNVKRQTIEATKTNIQIRQLISPIDGIVTKIEHAEGEYVREGEPVMEITQLDTLRAVCKIGVEYFSINQLEGKNVIVQVKKKNNNNPETFNGKIVFVNPQIVHASDEYEVYIEIKNQKIENNWKLQPGSRIIVKLKLYRSR
ncbi:MAG: HlyD family efflux transporter periplasmic adaptor subunit [Planctomycetaceae bacterium]|nr:HlyD family efflux transporter periplasmic adaptor subunit [Planctomycetaceae bacterium]